MSCRLILTLLLCSLSCFAKGSLIYDEVGVVTYKPTNRVPTASPTGITVEGTTSPSCDVAPWGTGCSPVLTTVTLQGEKQQMIPPQPFWSGLPPDICVNGCDPLNDIVERARTRYEKEDAKQQEAKMNAIKALPCKPCTVADFTEVEKKYPPPASVSISFHYRSMAAKQHKAFALFCLPHELTTQKGQKRQLEVCYLKN